MTYTPKTRPQPAAANTGALPKELNDALAAAESLLGERDRIHAVLVRTHTLIPELLSRREAARSALAQAEVGGNKDVSAIRQERLTVESERLSAVAQREGSIAALLDQESSLTEARDALVTAKDQYAAGAVAEFRVKYDAAVLALQTAWATGDALASALRFPVEMPLPIKMSGGRRETVSETAFPTYDPIRVERDLGPDTGRPVIDAIAGRIGTILDKLENAIDFANGLRASIRMQAQARMRETLRGWNPNGAYLVLRQFVCHNDALPFLQNQIIDASLLGLVSLQRAVASKSVRLLESAEAAVAA
jgi:hypothetical protein